MLLMLVMYLFSTSFLIYMSTKKGLCVLAGEYSREAVQLLAVARFDPGAHQEAPAAGLE